MRVHSIAGDYKASPEKLFNLLSKEENLPQWATVFCKGIRKDGEDYLIATEGGELYFKIDADSKTGVIDMLAGPAKDKMWNNPTRVVSNNMGGSLFIFTLIQSPGQSDEDFENGCKGLAEEVEAIRKLVDK